MNKIIGGVILVIIFLLGLFIGNRIITPKVEEKNDLINALTDSVEVWRDEAGLAHAKIKTLRTSSIKDFLEIETKNKEIKELQTLVEQYKNKLKNGGSVTSIKTVTQYDTIYKNNNSVFDDTLLPDNFFISDTINNNYFYTVFGFSMDSTFYNLRFKNDFSIIIGEEKQGWFKDPIPYVELISKNPYTEVSSLRSYEVKDFKNKRFGIGPSVGVGMNSDLEFKGYIGLSLNYNLIRF